MENVRNGITDLIKAVEKEDKERNIRALDFPSLNRGNLRILVD
jgi:hypothetical protein